MKIQELRNVLSTHLGEDSDRPVVVFSSLWLFLRVIDDVPKAEVIDCILDILMELVGPNRTLMLPAFSTGLRNGYADLDTDPSRTGIITEKFRQMPKTRRTVCPWFSFSCLGPDTAELTALMPRHAWGEGSVYEWLEKRDALFLMLGTDPSHCSYLHRVEWLNKNIVSYRYEKSFQGIVRHEGKELKINETLFVRQLDPEVINDFSVLNEDMINDGMKSVKFGGIPISSMTARRMHDVFSSRLRSDPFVAVLNRDEILEQML